MSTPAKPKKARAPKDPTFRRMRWSTFEREFKPIKNHIDPNASMDGIMFETFGKELDFVLAKANDPTERYKVWTVMESSTGSSTWYIGDGYHLVNRLGYLITENPFNPDISYETTY